MRKFITAMILAAALPLHANIKEDAPQPDIEIWLGEGIGRFGDKEFSIRGGSKKDPTPIGSFYVEWKSRKWWSRQYDAPMPYAVFFHKGAALHVGSMNGNSHGCVRLPEPIAKHIYYTSKEKQTRVIVYP